MLVGAGEAQKWMQEAREENPKDDIRDPVFNAVPSGGRKG